MHTQWNKNEIFFYLFNWETKDEQERKQRMLYNVLVYGSSAYR